MSRWYKLSLVSGLVPLCTGILIFLCWLVTRDNRLEMMGAYTISVGLGLFIVGIFCLTIYVIQSRNNGAVGYWKRSILSLVILVSNFPVAVAIFGAVIYVISISTVTIENRTKTKIKELVLSERNHVYNIGIVLPNEKLEKNYRFQSEGAVHYSFIRDQNKYEGIMFGYVTGGIGSEAIMLVTESGEVNIDQKI